MSFGELLQHRVPVAKEDKETKSECLTRADADSLARVFGVKVDGFKVALATGQAQDALNKVVKGIVPPILEPLWQAMRENRVFVEYHSLGIEVAAKSSEEEEQVAAALRSPEFELPAMVLWSRAFEVTDTNEMRPADLSLLMYNTSSLPKNFGFESDTVAVATVMVPVFRRSFGAIANSLGIESKFYEEKMTKKSHSTPVLFVSNYRSGIRGVSGGSSLDLDRIFDDVKDQDEVKRKLPNWIEDRREGKRLLQPPQSVFVLVAKCSSSCFSFLSKAFKKSLKDVFKSDEMKKDTLDLSWAVDSQTHSNADDLVPLLKKGLNVSVKILDLSHNYLRWPGDEAVFESVLDVCEQKGVFLERIVLSFNAIRRPNFSEWIFKFWAFSPNTTMDLRETTLAGAPDWLQDFKKMLSKKKSDLNLVLLE